MIPPLEIQSRVDARTLSSHKEERRTYLGASVIGEKCVRKLWYQFRWVGADQHEPRMLRLFQRGHREEPVFVELLKGAGFIVRTPAAEGEENFQFKDCEGHFAGEMDAVIAEGDHDKWKDFQIDEDTLEWCDASFKTVCKKDFADLKRVGVKENFPKYWAQEQTYMGELGFEWCLFCAVCKDNDELYFEWIPFNRQDFECYLTKAELIINAKVPPERISSDPNTFSCRYCHFKPICHANETLPDSQKHCRNCVNASPAENGSWTCSKRVFGTLCEDYHAIAG